MRRTSGFLMVVRSVPPVVQDSESTTDIGDAANVLIKYNTRIIAPQYGQIRVLYVYFRVLARNISRLVPNKPIGWVERALSYSFPFLFGAGWLIAVEDHSNTGMVYKVRCFLLGRAYLGQNQHNSHICFLWVPSELVPSFF